MNQAMGARIAVIVPNSTMSAADLDLRRAYLESVARPGTSVHVVRNDEGPASIETEAERDEASVHMLAQMRRLADKGYDAYIAWCASDPAVLSGRELLREPVVGPLQAASAYAATLGFRFSVVIPHGNVRMVRQRIADYGLGGSLASVRQINSSVLELRRDLAGTRKAIASEAAAAAAEGADALILGCMALFGVAATVDADLPIIDPAHAALAMAETLVAMRLAHSAASYAAVPPSSVTIS